MSSRARRLVQPAGVSPFPWAGPAPAAPDRPAPEPLEVPIERAVQAHQATLAELERDAFAKGFAQGERAGAEAAGRRGEAMLRRLTETLGELTDVRARMIHQTERQMVQLALAIARRVVHREVSLDHDLLIAMARVALDRLGESARVTIRLHPEEFEATAAARAREWASDSVQVVADARVERGGCRVESEFGMMDVGVDAQLQELARALLGEEAADDVRG